MHSACRAGITSRKLELHISHPIIIEVIWIAQIYMMCWSREAAKTRKSNAKRPWTRAVRRPIPSQALRGALHCAKLIPHKKFGCTTTMESSRVSPMSPLEAPHKNKIERKNSHWWGIFYRLLPCLIFFVVYTCLASGCYFSVCLFSSPCFCLSLSRSVLCCFQLR